MELEPLSNEQILELIRKDKAREQAVSNILSSIIASLGESPEISRIIDSYFSFVPLVREVFNENVSVRVGMREYPLKIKKGVKEEILKTFYENVKDKWVIAVDESQHSDDLIMSKDYFYRGSLAFGMKVSNSSTDREKILAVLSSFRISEDDESVKRKLDLLTYIQNLIVALYSAVLLLSREENIYALFIDGPLIRQLHSFLFVTFTLDELKKLFAVDPDIRRYVGNAAWLERNLRCDLFQENLTIEELAKGKLLELILESSAYKEMKKRLELSDDFNQVPEFKNAVLENGEVPGLFVYFFLLRLLNDLSKKHNFLVCGVVKSPRSKEFIRFYYSFAFAKVGDANRRFRYKVYSTGILGLSNNGELKFFKDFLREGKIHKALESLDFYDDHLLTFALDFDPTTAFYTSPFEIRRYRSREANRKEVYEADEDYQVYRTPFGSASNGLQHFWLEEILLRGLLPPEKLRFYMAYVRTSDIKFALRIEFPEAAFDRADELCCMVYLFSSVYRNYGIPVFLKYADNLVRVSTDLINRLAKGLLRERVVRELLGRTDGDRDALEIVKQVIFGMKRDFYSR